MALSWTLSTVEKYAVLFEKFKIIPDNVPHGSVESFEKFVLASRALWFEIVDEDKNEAIGVIFLDDFVPSPLENKYISASYHVSVWDAHFRERLPIHWAFVRAIFAQFGLHRLELEIPLYAGGAIRFAQVAGFKSEGTKRQARFSYGKWFDVAFFSILDSEVQ